MKKLKEMIKEGQESKPPVNYLVIFLFAGHGMIKEGAQVLLYNEFDENTGYYKMFKAEETIRQWAAQFQNSYFMGIFACCRQLYNSDTMEGNYSKIQLQNADKTLQEKRDSYEEKIKEIMSKLEELKAK